jgi:hypothetical protein
MKRTTYKEATYQFFDMPLDTREDAINYHLGTLAANLYRFVRQAEIKSHARFEPEPGDGRDGLRIPVAKGIDTRLAIADDDGVWLVDGRLPAPKETQAWTSEAASPVAVVEAPPHTVQVADFVGVLHAPRSESSGPRLDLSALGIEVRTIENACTPTSEEAVCDLDTEPAQALDIASAATLALCIDYGQMRHLWQIN